MAANILRVPGQDLHGFGIGPIFSLLYQLPTGFCAAFDRVGGRAGHVSLLFIDFGREISIVRSPLFRPFPWTRSGDAPWAGVEEGWPSGQRQQTVNLPT